MLIERPVNVRVYQRKLLRKLEDLKHVILHDKQVLSEVRSTISVLVLTTEADICVDLCSGNNRILSFCSGKVS
jgi:hypothetical protein